MKKHYAVLILSSLFSFLTSLSTYSQGIYRLWGVTNAGGSNNTGVIYSTRQDGSAYTIHKHFTETISGAAEWFNEPVAYNGKIYCILSEGSLGNGGVIGEYNIANGTWTKKADLYTIGGVRGQGSMTVYNNKLYGVCRASTNGGGLLFSFNPANNSLSALHDFDSLSGENPAYSLTLYNGKLYGITTYGGAHDDGVIYEFNPANNVYTKKADFEYNVTGNHAYGGKLTVYNNMMYGVSNNGGPDMYGGVYAFNPANNALQFKVSLSTINLYEFHGGLTVYNNRLYGACEHGGINFDGAIFNYNPANNSLSKNYDFNAGEARYAQSMSLYSGKLYGCSAGGGANSKGQLFSYDPLNNIYSSLHDLATATGGRGAAAVCVYNAQLWGLTMEGGDHHQGVLYNYNLLSNVYDPLVHFGGSELISPVGALTFFNQKLYGMTRAGGNFENENFPGGGIFEFDLATSVYQEKLSMSPLMGSPTYTGGFLQYNNKFYNITWTGGFNGDGTLFEYNPANNLFVVKHHFDDPNGASPSSAPTLFNGKLYGTCSKGGSNDDGTIYEYDLANNTFANKVMMSPSFGMRPEGGLTLFNNKLYGMTTDGGAFSKGTLYEYTPAGNIFIKKVDFDGVNASRGSGQLTTFNNKMYGITYFGGADNTGAVFEYTPGALTLTKKADLTPLSGHSSSGTFLAVGDKLVSNCSEAGTHNQGTVFSFDPQSNALNKLYDYSKITGEGVGGCDLISVPAPAAPGSLNNCVNTQTVNITAANANDWIAFTDAQGRAVAEINANGNILGNTMVRFYVNGGAVRQDNNGDYYLDRNITITPAAQPLSSVSIRIYVKAAEFDALAALPGSGVLTPADVKVFRNGDFCAGNLTMAKTQLGTLYSSWLTDYVYSCSSDSLASFYLGGANIPLPVELYSFSGKKESVVNVLDWDADCNGPVRFTAERSADATNFTALGVVDHHKDKGVFHFQFTDQHPFNGKNYYRLQMKDEDGNINYSQVILLDRNQEDAMSFNIVPNPVEASRLSMQICSPHSGLSQISISDMSGKILKQESIPVNKGKQTVRISLDGFGSGVYLMHYRQGEINISRRFSIQ